MLEKTVAGEAGSICDNLSCNRPMDPGTAIHRCQECDFDLCTACFGSGKPAKKSVVKAAAAKKSTTVSSAASVSASKTFALKKRATKAAVEDIDDTFADEPAPALPGILSEQQLEDAAVLRSGGPASWPAPPSREASISIPERPVKTSLERTPLRDAFERARVHRERLTAELPASSGS